MKKIVIFETRNIISVSEYIEGTRVFMPDGKGVLIHDDITIIIAMLTAIGVNTEQLTVNNGE